MWPKKTLEGLDVIMSHKLLLVSRHQSATRQAGEAFDICDTMANKYWCWLFSSVKCFWWDIFDNSEYLWLIFVHVQGFVQKLLFLLELLLQALYFHLQLDVLQQMKSSEVGQSNISCFIIIILIMTVCHAHIPKPVALSRLNKGATQTLNMGCQYS